MNKVGKILFLSGFWIKALALLAMTLSHICILIEMLPYGIPSNQYIFLDYIGRIALPLFCFGIAEGVIYTKSFSKYSLRLGIMASLISTVLLVANFIDVAGAETFTHFGNIYLDLLLGALAVWLLKQDKVYLKPLAILPIGVSITSFVVSSLESARVYESIDWFPWFLRTQYGFYGVLLILLFFFASKLSEAILNSYSSKMGLEKDVIFSPGSERFLANLFSVVFLIGGTILYYSISNECAPRSIPSYQCYAMLAALPLFFYNGKRGYNAKWFQMGCYVYYPLHMVIILGIYLILENYIYL